MSTIKYKYLNIINILLLISSVYILYTPATLYAEEPELGPTIRQDFEAELGTISPPAVPRARYEAGPHVRLDFEAELETISPPLPSVRYEAGPHIRIDFEGELSPDT